MHKILMVTFIAGMLAFGNMKAQPSDDVHKNEKRYVEIDKDVVSGSFGKSANEILTKQGCGIINKIKLPTDRLPKSVR